jgi:hypothetical protein
LASWKWLAENESGDGIPVRLGLKAKCQMRILRILRIFPRQAHAGVEHQIKVVQCVVRGVDGLEKIRNIHNIRIPRSRRGIVTGRT